MEINRRNLLKCAGAGGAVAFLGGLQIVRQSYARDSLYQEMMSETVPLMAAKSDKELTSLPAAAREDIRDYFTTVCVKVHGFVTAICSATFAEKIAECGSEDQRHRLLNVAFSQNVVTGIEVLNRVETIARETGKELDRNWAGCCEKLSASWNTSLSKRSSGEKAVDVFKLLEPLILQHLNDARQAAYSVDRRPAVSQIVTEIGKSAILLLTVGKVAPEIEFPVFVVVALVHLWKWVLAQLSDRPADYQTAITERLSLLGNRVGDEFQQELRLRIADLQKLQDDSLRDAAHRKADEIIPVLF